MSEIAIRLGSRRNAHRLSQQQLADRTGLRRDTISALERGKSRGIDFKALALLCDALACTPSDLLELAASPHVAPILGGPDEDEIIAERVAEAEGEIAALLADPTLAALALTSIWDETDDGSATTAVDFSPDQPFPLGPARHEAEIATGNGPPHPVLTEDRATATMPRDAGLRRR